MMLKSQQWHVHILGKSGILVPLYYRDNSPVILFYHLLWHVGLRMYQDTSKRGHTQLRPCPQFDSVSPGSTANRMYNVVFSGKLRAPAFLTEFLSCRLRRSSMPPSDG